MNLWLRLNFTTEVRKYRLKCEISRPTALENMQEKDKKRDPMPPPDATPEEIGEFWDTHSLSDYWAETHEVDFQVNLKLKHNLVLKTDGCH